jgi:hypothetical protein
VDAHAEVSPSEEELAQAFVALLTLGDNPSQERVREVAQRVARLVWELVQQARSRSFELLTKRLQRTEAILRIFGGSSWWSAEQIDALFVPPGSKHHTAIEWKRHEQIFSVRVGGDEYFPAYQFDAASHEPIPIIGEVLKAFGPVEDTWTLAIWFHRPNRWISRPGADGKEVLLAPKDALAMPQAILQAATNRQDTDA